MVSSVLGLRLWVTGCVHMFSPKIHLIDSFAFCERHRYIKSSYWRNWLQKRLKISTIISWVRRDRALVKFELKITLLPRATFLDSSSDNIVACNFRRFAANDVKGRQVGPGNEASWPWQQHKLNQLKPGHKTFLEPYSTDNLRFGHGRSA